MNKGRLKIILAILAVLIIAFFISNNLLQKPPSKISEDPIQDQVKEEPKFELEESFITLYSEDGKVRWELGAKSMQQFDVATKVTLNQVEAKIYQDKEEVVNLIADKGEVDIETGFIGLKGPITIKSKEKSLKADKLNWNKAKNELIGLGNILIKQEGLRIKGDRFVSQVDLKRLRVLGNIKVISQEVGENNEK
ncbi:LPS export ABC transporter periplasmic protein LptC [Orenia marismortui]|uniref:LPS export ABC transporter protein LptC n=1 Tax=Orenia marismortui TaxID=46469 RepID=A0A4R8HI89_9FIRM|nr:LPS export ABC transporter periplasmic protein LptC [Orenia marismortui]TDX59218.1 LPS export ABC transporter protein LptC [Orenia marismortui]